MLALGEKGSISPIKTKKGVPDYRRTARGQVPHLPLGLCIDSYSNDLHLFNKPHEPNLRCLGIQDDLEWANHEK